MKYSGERERELNYNKIWKRSDDEEEEALSMLKGNYVLFIYFCCCCWEDFSPLSLCNITSRYLFNLLNNNNINQCNACVVGMKDNKRERKKIDK